MNVVSPRPDGADPQSITPDSNPTAAPAAATAPAEPGFDTFGLDPRILRALADLGFTRPTPIQVKALAPLIAGRDVIGRARTGTGKTAAFGLPMVQRLAPPEGGGRAPASGVKALVLAPTRELALQVSEAIQSFAKFLNIRVATLYGGASYVPQLRALREGAQIVVGTPGRLIDHLDRKTLDLSNVQMVVLDEADEMLRMGFIEDVERLMGATPPTRQVALFSATMPDAIRRVADKYLNKPDLVQDESGPTSVVAIDQQWIYVPQRFKGEALLRLLRGEPRGTTLVFARTRAGAGEAADALAQAGFQVEALHGDLSQAARERVLDLFRARRLDVVVATDVAARGIDIDHITHVINFDLPENGEVYTHRIGRTGRAGRSGAAITLVTPSQIRIWRGMLKQIRNDAREIQLPTDAAIATRQREALRDDFARVPASSRLKVAGEWVKLMMAEKGWTEIDVATRALMVLADDRGANLEENPSDEPETWGQPQLVKKPDARRDSPRPTQRDDRFPAYGGRDDRPQQRDDWQQQRPQQRDDWQQQRPQQRDDWQQQRPQQRDDWQQQRPQQRDDWQQQRPQQRDDWQQDRPQQRPQQRDDWQQQRPQQRDDWQQDRAPQRAAEKPVREYPAAAPKSGLMSPEKAARKSVETPAAERPTRPAARDEAFAPAKERPARPAARDEAFAPAKERPARPAARDEAFAPAKERPARPAARDEAFAPAKERPARPAARAEAFAPAKERPVRSARDSASEKPEAVRPAKKSRDDAAEWIESKPTRPTRPPIDLDGPEPKAVIKARKKAPDEVEVSLAVGEQAGVTAADIFGAFANEAGLSRDEIGRISIHERVSVVRLGRPIASVICNRFSALHVRGKKVPLIGPPPGSLMPRDAGMAPPKRGSKAASSDDAPAKPKSKAKKA